MKLEVVKRILKYKDKFYEQNSQLFQKCVAGNVLSGTE